MILGFDAKRLFCNFTGLGNYSRTIVSNLQKYYPGNEFHLYSSKSKINPETELFYNKPFNTFIYKSIFKYYWRSIGIINNIKKDNIQLYHGLSNELPENINKANIKSIVTIHDLIFKILPDNYIRTDRRIYNHKFKNACFKSDKIIAISQSTKNDIVNFYNINPDKISVIYQSCNPIFYETNVINDKSFFAELKIPNDYLLYVGSIQTRKNLKTLIQSYQFLPSDLRIPLVIVGKGKKYKEEVKELVDKMGISNIVIWIETLQDNKQLKTVYQNAKALIYPSLFEGFGLPVAEALLCRTPVITSNSSSLPEAGGSDSLYFNPKDPEELAFNIQKVLTDSSLREVMINNGYNYAIENFAPEKTTQNIINLYKSLI